MHGPGTTKPTVSSDAMTIKEFELSQTRTTLRRRPYENFCPTSWPSTGGRSVRSSRRAADLPQVGRDRSRLGQLLIELTERRLQLLQG